MRKIIRGILFLVLLLTMLLSTLVWCYEIVQASGGSEGAIAYEAAIIDEADLFTDQEEREILKSMESFTQYGNALVASSMVNNCKTVQKLAVKYYDQAFGTQQGAIFLIDMDNREIYWYSEGNIYDKLSVKSAMAITDNVYKYATKGEFATCAMKAFEQAVTVIEKGHIRQSMKIYGNALLALILALFANYIFLRRSSFLRPAKEEAHEIYEDHRELVDIVPTFLTQETKKKQYRESVFGQQYRGSGFSSYSTSSSSSYSGSSSSSSSSRSSSSSSSSSSRSSSSSSSSSRSSSSGGHRGGGAGHRF